MNSSTVRSSLNLWRAFLPAFAGLYLARPSESLGQAATGAVSLRIANQSTDAYLEGVEASVVGTPLSVLTGRDGAYKLAGVASGTQTLRVFYPGLRLEMKSMELVPGQARKLTIALGADVVQMESFTVSNSREGETASLAKQRNADHIMNFVSMQATSPTRTATGEHYLLVIVIARR